MKIYKIIPILILLASMFAINVGCTISPVQKTWDSVYNEVYEEETYGDYKVISMNYVNCQISQTSGTQYNVTFFPQGLVEIYHKGGLIQQIYSQSGWVSGPLHIYNENYLVVSFWRDDSKTGKQVDVQFYKRNEYSENFQKEYWVADKEQLKDQIVDVSLVYDQSLGYLALVMRSIDKVYMLNPYINYRYEVSGYGKKVDIIGFYHDYTGYQNNNGRAIKIKETPSVAILSNGYLEFKDHDKKQYWEKKLFPEYSTKRVKFVSVKKEYKGVTYFGSVEIPQNVPDIYNISISNNNIIVKSNSNQWKIDFNGNVIDSKKIDVPIDIPSNNKLPIANAGNNQSGFTGEELIFDGSGSNDSDGAIVKYTWDFGDGASEIGIKVKHTYNKSGNYSVSLTVTDNNGGISTSTVNIKVEEKNIVLSESGSNSFGNNFALIGVGLFLLILIGAIAISKSKNKTEGPNDDKTSIYGENKDGIPEEQKTQIYSESGEAEATTSESETQIYSDSEGTVASDTTVVTEDTFVEWPEAPVCANCGAEIKENWVKCPQCMEFIKKGCPKCGGEIQSGWKACPSCGEKL